MSTAFLKRERQQLEEYDADFYDSDETELESTEAPVPLMTWAAARQSMFDVDMDAVIRSFINRMPQEKSRSHMWYMLRMYGHPLTFLRWLPRAALEPVIEEQSHSMYIWNFWYRKDLGWE